MSPFDWRSVLLARHAQHVVLVHFPIALFMIGVLFDVLALWRRRDEFALVAYYNFCIAAVFTIPTILTGLLAWQWALEGQWLKGTLLLHLLCGLGASLIIVTVWLLEHRERVAEASRAAKIYKFALEFIGVGLLSLTGHLGGFLSGVNGAP